MPDNVGWRQCEFCNGSGYSLFANSECPEPLSSKNQVPTEPISEQTKAFLRWVREICVDDSRTYYRGIQGIMDVIYHFEKGRRGATSGRDVRISSSGMHLRLSEHNRASRTEGFGLPVSRQRS